MSFFDRKLSPGVVFLQTHNDILPPPRLWYAGNATYFRTSATSGEGDLSLFGSQKKGSTTFDDRKTFFSLQGEPRRTVKQSGVTLFFTLFFLLFPQWLWAVGFPLFREVLTTSSLALGSHRALCKSYMSFERTAWQAHVKICSFRYRTLRVGLGETSWLILIK